MTTATQIITRQHIDAFQRDGAVLIPGLFRDWTDVLIAGIDRNMAEPGPHASENQRTGEAGRFFDDYCNWPRIPEFSDFVMKSDAAAAAAQLMQSKRVQVFHDHVLVKEPGTSKPTPWHQDSPYYFVDGEQTVSFWIPVDPVKEASLRLVAGSHLWDKPVLPTRWFSDEDFYASEDEYLPVPDPDADPDKYSVLEWEMEPGDAVAFHYKTLHGARGNRTDARRRAFSLRLVGDDARYTERPGPTSPPFDGHDMQPGQTLREDWFPVVWQG
ncbi:phytanoyl-CoA dioxygenase family protein [Sneathiella marina]|uniref:Phytanoyl-CoA dioxygenase family protein n=1 Tax=Sneathiella marina TaxID=2950108 RepID=A0ABY4W2C7_9PROT|nr:phytanoyl-CoA dioxygenase family protein [Sneathiella marina]USG60991.1 phytanoyl-CoA dioxygenase family protein [Sneathiella marina]